MGIVKISPEEVKGIKYLGIVSGKVHYLSSAANIHRLILLTSVFAVFKVDMQFLLFFLHCILFVFFRLYGCLFALHN